MDKESLLKHPLTLLVSFFILLFLFLQFGPKLPISIVSQEKGQPLVVAGTGKVTAVPDIAKVSLGIEQTGTSLLDVEKSVNAKSKSLVDALKKLGIGEKDIKTTSYNVYPDYDYREAASSAYRSQPAKIIGYRVGTTYEVKVKDFDKVNDVVAKATEVGANMIGGITFQVNEDTKNKLLDEARHEAVAEAKQKAESIARAAGVSLGKIINISENQNFQPVPLPLSGGGVMKETVPAPDIQPGETELSVTVSLSFELR